MSPKRIVDGEAIATSEKLLLVPVQFRGELALLLTLQLANGTFEAEARKVWAQRYAFNRHFTPEMVDEMLDAYEAAKILFRWTEPDGKLWGCFVKSDLPGRLPGKSRRGRNEKTGPPVPKAALEQFLRNSVGNGNKSFPNGNEVFPGNGSGSGLGLGSGKGIGAGIGIASGSEPNAEYEAPSYIGAKQVATQNTNAEYNATASPTTAPSLLGANTKSTTPNTNTNTERTAAAPPKSQAPLARATTSKATPSAPQRSTPASVEDIVNAFPMTPTNQYVRQGWLMRTEEEVFKLVQMCRFATTQEARDYLLDRAERYAASKPEHTYSMKSFLAQEIYDQGWLDRDDVTRAVSKLRAGVGGGESVEARSMRGSAASALWNEGEQEQEVEDDEEPEAAGDEDGEEKSYWQD